MNKRVAIFYEVMLVALFYFAVAISLTWPTVMHLDEVILGGGELGGWLWRVWWHFEEVRALEAQGLGWIGGVEALVALGRFPETGNILDVLLLSYPLNQWFGFPVDHNAKILLILFGNGFCGYVLARTFTGSKWVALGAGSIAMINPLVLQDINKLGLRQTILWFLLLFPVFLQRAERTGRVRDGVMVGICFTLIAAFYWFYGLFAALFGLMWLVFLWAQERPPIRYELRWISAAFFTAVAGLFAFLLPYFSAGQESGGKGGMERLPELTFFLPYPAYDTIASAPQRPTNYRENVLSSLHRGIDSSWPADFILDPRHGVMALPVFVFLLGVIPAVFLRRSRFWLVVFLFFYVGTLGPFLKWGSQLDTSEVVRWGEYVFRLPYTLMFQYIPGMSRMFAPYRLSCMVVVAAIPLVAIALDRLRRDRQWIAGFLLTAGVVLQPFYRFDMGPVGVGQARPSSWRIPTQVSAMQIPDWYQELDPQGWEGIIELPLEQQQDLLCTYQTVHHRKVYRSWATMSAIPDWIRHSGGGDAGRRLRWLAKEPPQRDGMENLFRDLSRDPSSADFGSFENIHLNRLMDSGGYRWLIIHERGFYLLNPNEGDLKYREVVRKMSERLGMVPNEVVEQKSFEWPGKTRHFPVGPAWIPWASQEVQRPTIDMPDRYFMSVFDLHEWEGRGETD